MSSDTSPSCGSEGENANTVELEAALENFAGEWSPCLRKDPHGH